MEKIPSMAALTARDVERLQPPEQGRIDIYDPGCKGLVLRVGQRRKTWIVRHRPSGQPGAKPQVIKIGTVGAAVDMKAIRVLARQKIAEIDAGADLVAEKRRARAAQTIDQLAALYLERWAALQKKASSMSNDEIRTLWGVLDGVPQTIADMYRLALLTAQRPGEIKRLAWSEIDLDGATWTLPAARAKNGKAHGIPLSAGAMDIVRRRRAVAEGKPEHPYVFPGRLPLSPLTEIQKWEAHIQKTCGFAFQLRDLRRTAATRIAESGAGRFIGARILNHADGSITAVYDRFEYANEMRAALIIESRII